MQTYFISINNNAPRVKHGENQKPSCYVNITSFRMMADITLIVIPDATSAARLLCNPWLGSRMCCRPVAKDVDSDAGGPLRTESAALGNANR